MTTKWLRLAATWILTVGCLLAQSQLSKEDLACLKCHAKAGLSKKDANGKSISLFVDPQKFIDSVHGGNGCTSCHADMGDGPHPGKGTPKPVSCGPCHDKAESTYNASVHGSARRAGNTSAAQCVDCHGNHAIVPIRMQASPMNRANLGATCGKCHPQIFEEVQQSAHGQAMARGEREAPTCTDCHGDHTIETLRGATSLKIAEQVCSRCHASQRMNVKYGLPSNRVSSFFESYHGLAIKAGSAQAANCASCHGFHNILPASDPRSSVNPANMVATCQKCHPGIGEKFIVGKVHMDQTVITETGDKVNAWVRRAYLSMIFATIGLMLLHNGLAFRRKLLLSLRDPSRTVIRMKLAHRIQHILLVTSFSYLALSGFALKYPDSWLTYILGSSENLRRTGHRVAAVVMILLAIGHLIYVIVTPDGRSFVRDMLPARKDLQDLMNNLKHYFKLGSAKPRFGRFWYAEKAEYWAVVWGTAIMAGTGLLIWFKVQFTHWISRWVIEVAITMHYYEAILACLSIFVWHFYFVIFDPDVYPVNWAWLDGKVSTKHGEEGPSSESNENEAQPQSEDEEPR